MAVTRKGYQRVWHAGRQVMEHVLVWQKHHGPVPEGMQVHHINEDKLDNRIENLQLLTPLEHKRFHSGAYRKEGEWWLKCKKCFQHFPEAHFYKTSQGHPTSWCRRCFIARSIRNKQSRAMKRRALREHLQARQGSDHAVQLHSATATGGSP